MPETYIEQSLHHRTEEKSFAALRNAVHLWAEAVTNQSSHNRTAAVRDKSSSVEGFFELIKKLPNEICEGDVARWRGEMEARQLKPNTIYARLSRLAAFFEWLMRDPQLGAHLGRNPARRMLPKRPKSYQGEATKAFSDEEIRSLLNSVKSEASAGSTAAKRDYAMLLIYFLTGLRRQEVISLRGTDVELTREGLIINYRRKGGHYVGRELTEPSVVAALDEYLRAAGRENVLGSERPLWTRHDRAGTAGGPLSSHSFAKNLKAYGAKAGVENVRIHRTRHTFGRLVAEKTGSIIETQDALDHADLATTRIYVERIVVKKDKYSRAIAAGLQIGPGDEK